MFENSHASCFHSAFVYDLTQKLYSHITGHSQLCKYCSFQKNISLTLIFCSPQHLCNKVHNIRNSFSSFIYNILTLSQSTKCICTSFRNRQKSELLTRFQPVSQRVQINLIFNDNVHILCLSCNIKKQFRNLWAGLKSLFVGLKVYSQASKVYSQATNKAKIYSCGINCVYPAISKSPIQLPN